ncbi:MAG: type III-A CRISPR-associated protein Cas10/Csm1 [Ignavibacteriales bacterium UTCHB2]|jgi:CRISPR-associated protein Csm1|nr:MAG: type III-A CRISPR-associated protein Cas10/Csm1 [Ignavibacteriales bacterium UTCHB2]
MEYLMNELDSLYIASLLHDIGKFIERAKDNRIQQEALSYYEQKIVSKNYAHKRYSAWLIDKFKKEKDFLKDETIKTLVLWHHRGDDQNCDDYESINRKGVLLKLLRIADDLASSERRENPELEAVDYYLAKIHSPFQSIQLELNNELKQLTGKYYLNKEKLALDKKYGFPNNLNVDKTNCYQELVKDFLNEFKYVENDESLLYLIEKYLTNVPAQTPVEINGKEMLFKPDINLFDHSRSVAAIAVCLFLEYKFGSWQAKDKQILTNDYYQQDLEEPIILINGNLTGIQNFIFDVKSEKAAQKLKGKSFFIQLLADVCVKYLLEKLELKPANLLYNGGGNFFILAPAYKEKQLNKVTEQIITMLKSLDIYLAFGLVKVGLEDFSDFSRVFSNVTKEANKNKQQKFKQLNWETVFNPTSQKLNEDEFYKRLTEELVCDEILIRNYRENEILSEYQKPFITLNYAVEFHPETTGISSESIIFNSTDFARTHKGFRFAVKDLPLWNKKNIEMFEKLNEEYNHKFETKGDEKLYPNSIISFERLSQYSYFETGTQKLGVLKMDIDNLGKLFSEGLPKEFEYKTKEGQIKRESYRTISRIASLSRAIKWFFEGYINLLINLPEYKDRLYVVFSGGDDFFVVGSWNKVFSFAEKVRNEFCEFVCNHTAITLSATLLVVDEKYPVSRFAAIAEERLHKAKYQSKSKNSISVFDIVVSWDDFHKAKLLKEKLVGLVNETGKRAVIEKIRKSTKGFEKIKSQAELGKVEMIKVWRLAYYLREMFNPKEKDEKMMSIKDKVEEIVKQYEVLIFEALKGESTSIKIFPIAARWAEFETKNLLNKEMKND